VSHKKRKKLPKNYTPISNSHCKVRDVIDAIYYSIKINWITEEEFDEIYKQVKKKLKKDKNV